MSDNWEVTCFRETRQEALESFAPEMTGPMLALPKAARQELGIVIDVTLMQLVEWRDRKAIQERKGDTALDDIIADLQWLANLTDDESNYDGTDPDYHMGFLNVEAIPSVKRMALAEAAPVVSPKWDPFAFYMSFMLAIVRTLVADSLAMAKRRQTRTRRRRQ